MTRRNVLQLLGAGVALPTIASLAGCSVDTVAAVKGGGKLTYVYNGAARDAAAQKAQFSAFLKANPKIEFTAQGIAAATWASYADTIATRIAGGAAPDVVDIATEGLGLFRSKKLVKPLDPFIKKNQAAIDNYYADIDPTFKKISDKYGNPGGTTYFMPGGFNPVCIWANVDLFKKAGVDLPGDNDWTWDDFEAAAVKIKQKTGAFIGVGDSAQFTGVMPWLLTNGASTLNATWDKAIVDSDAAIEAAQFVAKLVAKGLLAKPGGTVDAPALLAQGKIATVAAGRWVLGEFRTLNQIDNLQIVKFPKKTTNGSPIGWDAFPILSSSENEDAAWSFVEFLTTKENGIAFAKAGGNNVPARKSVALSSAFLENAPKGSEQLYKAAEYATAVPSPDRGDLTQTAIEAAWLSIISGQTAADKGLKQLNDKLSSLL